MGPRAKLCGIAERNHGPGITGNLVIRMARAYGRADNDMLVETTVSLELQHAATSAPGSTTQRSDRLPSQKLIPSLSSLHLLVRDYKFLLHFSLPPNFHSSCRRA
jgi:hypothetical protein